MLMGRKMRGGAMLCYAMIGTVVALGSRSQSRSCHCDLYPFRGRSATPSEFSEGGGEAVIPARQRRGYVRVCMERGGGYP